MAKRINTPFVISVVAVMGLGFGIVLLGPALKNLASKPNNAKAVEQLRETARKYLKEGKPLEAREAITQAYLKDRSNLEVCVERGDILAQLTEVEGQAVMDQARKSWEDALGMNPSYMPAMRRLLNSYIDQMDVAPTAQTCVRVHDISERILKVEPDNARAKAYVHIAAIERWVLGTPASAFEINKSINALEEILKKDPSSGEALFYIVRAKAYRANDLLRADRREEAMQLLADCRTLLGKSAAAFPSDANLNFRIFQGFVILIDTEREPVQVAVDSKSASAALRVAYEQIHDTDPRYADYQYVASEWERRNKRPEEAEKILREFYRRHDTDQRARLGLCRILALTGDEAKRDEAIEILKKPIVLTPGASGPRTQIMKELESQTLLDLATLRIAKYPTVEASKRPAMLKEIEDAYKAIDGIAQPDAIPLLRLQGLIHKIKNEKVEAVESLARAMTLLEHSDPNNPIKYDLMHQLALADRDAGQNKSAEKLLAQIVDHVDSYMPARLELADILLQENELDAAGVQIDALSKMAPNSSDVIRLAITLNVRSKHLDEANRYYSLLSENTFGDKLVKAQSAANLQNWKETIRILTTMQQEKPNDVGITVAVIHAYAKNNEPERAHQILAEAMKRFPKDVGLQMLTNELDTATSTQPHPWDLVVTPDGDPFVKEIAFGRINLQKGEFAQAMEHARMADSIRSNDPATYDLYFYIYAGQKDWSKAAIATENLARLDADRAGGRIYRWILASARGQFLDAIDIGRELTIYRESFGQSWVLLAKAYQSNGQYSEAISNYQSALERQTTNIEAYEGMAECYNALFQPERGHEAILKARQLFPENVRLRELDLGYQGNVNPVAVIASRRALLDAHPEDPENYLALAAVCVRAARKTYAVDPVQADAYMTQARDVTTKGVGKFPEDLRLNSSLAEVLLTSKRTEDGVKVLQDLAQTKAWKDKPEPLLILADFYSRARNLPLAEKAMREAWAKTNNKDINIELHLAQFLSEHGMFGDALLVLKANADDVRIVTQTLEVHVAANHTAQAEQGVLAALAKQPRNTDLLNLLSLVYIEGLRYPEARAKAAEVLAIDSRNETALYYQAVANLRDPINGDIGVALRDFQIITNHNTRNVKYKVEYANALLLVKNVDGATVQLEDAVRADPFNTESRIRLLDLYQANKKWAQFETVVRDAELHPATNRDATWTKKHAFALADQGLYPQALEKIHEAIALSPQDPTYARDYLMILLQSHNYDEVMRETTKLLDGVAGAPPHREWWVYHLRAMAQMEGGKIPEAMEQFVKALAAATEAKDNDAFLQIIGSVATISPDDAIARLAPRLSESSTFRIENVLLHMQKSDWPGALVALEPLMKSLDTLDRAERMSVIRFAAQTYQNVGQPMKSKLWYEKWLQIAPNDTAALNNMACLVAEDLKQPAEARQYSQRAYDFGRKFNVLDISETDTHGWVLTLCGGQAAQEGLAILDHLVATNADFIDARYHLGVAFARLKHKSDAIRHLEIALAQINAQAGKNQPVNSQLKASIETELDKARHMPGPA